MAGALMEKVFNLFGMDTQDAEEYDDDDVMDKQMQMQ